MEPTTEVQFADELFTDEGVLLGYPSGRCLSTLLTIGRGARFRSGTVIYSGTAIGDRFETGHNVVVREENTIGDDVSIWSNTVVDYGCSIGDRVKIHSNCYVAQFTELEEDVFLAPGVTVANDLFPGALESAQAMAGPRICRGAQIGVNVTILPYVTIGPGAIVGGGSVVTKDLPGHMVAYGSPARPIRPVPESHAVFEQVMRRRAARFSPPDELEPTASVRRVGP
ncbi:MAG TPA: acyltransferase [Actinomycetota bacterium]|nr:acyltransferase [Actinomycetota bacterium]